MIVESNSNSPPPSLPPASFPVQIINAGKIAVINSTVSNTAQPPSESGREVSIAEISGALRMAGSNLVHVGANVTIINEISPSPSPSTSTLTSTTFPTPPSPTSRKASKKKKNRTSFRAPLSYPQTPQPTLSEREYTYKNGSQYPADLKIQAGSVLDVLLRTSPMIEVLSVHQKRSENYYAAVCHSCEKEYKSCTATYLYTHTGLPVHRRRLTAPKDHLEVDVREHSRRQLLLTNPKFSPFLELKEEEEEEGARQSLWCKWCTLQLPFVNAKINDHRYTVRHIAAADGYDGVVAVAETERLEKLRRLVDLYPDVLALVDEVDKRINDEVFEYYKLPEEITLQLNDLYCKPCRRKFTRSNPNYRKAVLKHFKTRNHKNAVEKQQALSAGRGSSGAHAKIRPMAPPKKITTYRRHLKEQKGELKAVNNIW